MKSTLSSIRTPDQAIEFAAAGYRERFGWPVEVIGNQVMLGLGHGLIGVSMSPGHAGELNGALLRHGLAYPVLWLPTPRSRWGFLAAHTGPLPHAPYFAGLLANLRVPLPPSSATNGPLSWVVPPEECVGEPPALDCLLAVSHRQH